MAPTSSLSVKGWPPRLRAIAATALLVKEADRLTLGQNLDITAPHAAEALLRSSPERWMTNSRIAQYRALLYQPRINFSKVTVINLADLLPDPDPETPVHDCIDFTEAVCSSRPDLKDSPPPEADEVPFTDGSSFVQGGRRYAGAAVVTDWHHPVTGSSL